MKITEIHGYHLRVVPPRPLGNARTFIRQRDFLLVQVVCDNGVTGWGEAFSSPWATAALIRHQFARIVLGRSPQTYGRLYAEMVATLGYDRRGPAMMAISAIDLALHDAAARAHGVRVADLLGGALRESIPGYASGPFIAEGADPYGHFVAEAGRYLEQGFKALKPRGGVSPAADGAMLGALRAAVGPDIELMVDINQGYTASAACMAARRMEEHGPLWIEEPVGPEDVRGYQAVARASGIPVSGGEALGSLAAVREFLEASAVAILQPDLGVCGGFSGFQRVAALAAAYDVPVMPHAFGSLVNFYAALQMASLLPERRGGGRRPYPYAEYDPTGNPLMDLFGFPLGADGQFALPDGPGLGIDLRPGMIEPWTIERWTVTP